MGKTNWDFKIASEFNGILEKCAAWHMDHDAQRELNILFPEVIAKGESHFPARFS